jgi:hypothetical protein
LGRCQAADAAPTPTQLPGLVHASDSIPAIGKPAPPDSTILLDDHTGAADTAATAAPTDATRAPHKSKQTTSGRRTLRRTGIDQSLAPRMTAIIPSNPVSCQQKTTAHRANRDARFAGRKQPRDQRPTMRLLPRARERVDRRRPRSCTGRSAGVEGQGACAVAFAKPKRQPVPLDPRDCNRVHASASTDAARAPAPDDVQASAREPGHTRSRWSLRKRSRGSAVRRAGSSLASVRSPSPRTTDKTRHEHVSDC